ncbi:MAG TPA: hypothetical protein VKF35_11105 [Hyphomicrobiaceae bacterium]|nr:hypothetical protein [Hyphomicrobiaceae bacterium]
MTEVWPWLAVAGLGALHGLNPGMGWLFAVALGLHRGSRRVVYVSLLPIAAGHALSIITVAGLLAASDYVFPTRAARLATGILLIGWAAYHWRFGHRHRVRFGLQVGLVGLTVWSFLMATAHGAGLMLWPALIPLCGAQSPAVAPADGSWAGVLAGVGLHSLTMLATIAIVAAVIYEWVGLAVLKSAWVNVDLIWMLALGATGAFLLLVWSS